MDEVIIYQLFNTNHPNFYTIKTACCPKLFSSKTLTAVRQND